MTSAGVERIITKNGKAVGVTLDDGKEIYTRKLVASSIDPSTLVLKLIGEDYLEKRIIKNIKRIEWGDAVMAMYLALGGPVRYHVGKEVISSAQLHPSPASIDFLAV